MININIISLHNRKCVDDGHILDHDRIGYNYLVKKEHSATYLSVSKITINFDIRQI